MTGTTPTGVTDHLRSTARTLRDRIEPLIGQVYFSPEAHAEYVALGFAASPGTISGGVHLPDGPAYFTSRGSLLGQVPGEVVAAAFGVFNPEIVVPCVAFGWGCTDADTIYDARHRGGVAQLERVLGGVPDGVERAVALLRRAIEPLQPPSRPLFAGLLARPWPGDPLGDLFHAGDLLREYRGDSHNIAWSAAGLDAAEIGLLTGLYWGIPMRTYVRSRAWSDEVLDAATERLRARGWLDGDGFSPAGRAAREHIEDVTDAQMAPAIDALGDDAPELLDILEPWGKAMVAAGGYPAAATSLLGRRT